MGEVPLYASPLSSEIGTCKTAVESRFWSCLEPFPEQHFQNASSLDGGAGFQNRDWYFVAEQPAPAPHLAHPEGCAALRIVPVTVPRASRSCKHFQDGSDVHLLQGVRTAPVRITSRGAHRPSTEREFFIDNLLVRIPFIIDMIWWSGLAPRKFEFPFPGSLTSTFPVIPHLCVCRPSYTTASLDTPLL